MNRLIGIAALVALAVPVWVQAQVDQCFGANTYTMGSYMSLTDSKSGTGGTMLSIGLQAAVNANCTYMLVGNAAGWNVAFNAAVMSGAPPMRTCSWLITNVPQVSRLCVLSSELDGLPVELMEFSVDAASDGAEEGEAAASE